LLDRAPVPATLGQRQYSRFADAQIGESLHRALFAALQTAYPANMVGNAAEREAIRTKRVGEDARMLVSMDNRSDHDVV